MVLAELWNDGTPSRRCDWIDQLRGWAVIVMIEVHCVNVWLLNGARPDWLNYLNGLVAPSFLMCAGFSLVLSTFRPDGTIPPFFPHTARRLGFILICAYALHAPGVTLADWTVLSTVQKFRELFKIDVLQCVVISLAILHGLARLVRNPRVFTGLALGLVLWIPFLSPYLWSQGIGDGLWLPVRGLLNGNADRGLQALFPLFPWFAFPAFGAFLGGLYRWGRVEVDPAQRARFPELRWLAWLFLLGLGCWAWGAHVKESWLWNGIWVQEGGLWRLHSSWGAWTWVELQAIHNTTLPSVVERLGWISMAGAVLGAVELIRPRWKGPNPVVAASRESLLLYMLHLNVIFGILLSPPVLNATGWDWNSLGWTGTLLLTGLILGLNVVAGILWQRIRKVSDQMRRLQRWGLAVLAIWFLVGGWWTFRFYLQSPELAREAYVFLPAARARKGLPPTPDGLTRDPEEYFLEAGRRHVHMNPEARTKIQEQIQRRSTQ